MSFHRALQYFAGHLDHLRKIEVTSFASDFKEEARRTSYTNIVDSLKQLLCEVQDGFENEKGLTKISPKKMKIRIPVHNVKLTYAQLYDSDMLKKMNSFFKKVKKNIFRAIKSKKRNKSVVNKTKRTSSWISLWLWSFLNYNVIKETSHSSNVVLFIIYFIIYYNLLFYYNKKFCKKKNLFIFCHLT